MTNLRRLAAGLTAATALTMFAAPASAQRIDRIVAFGDSYADDGNLFQLIGIAPPAPYSTGRFSGGSNYIDALSQLLDAPVDNFAIGGALTDNRNTNGPPLGFVTEYGAFLSGGGGAFPSVSGSFNEGDLLAVSVGGNDARFYQQQGGTLAGASAAGSASAAAASTGLDALVGAGARNISFLAGNTAILPEVANDPAAQAIRNDYSTTFNGAIQSTLAGYAADGVIVHYLDLTTVGQNIIANPAAYGFTGVACPALPDTSCISNQTLANQFLFYFDQLHLTSAGFAVVGKYIATQLTAPLTLQAASDIGLDTARQYGRTLTARLDSGSPRDGDSLTGLRVFAAGDTFARKAGASDTNDAFRSTTVGATLGVEYGFGTGVVGIAGNYSKPRANFFNDKADNKARSLQIGGYAGFAIAGAFAQGYLGYGSDDHDIRRSGVVSDLEGDADGSHVLAGAKAGYLMNVGVLRAGPVVALDYARATVEDYTEAGDAALTLNVDEVRYSSLRGSAGVEVRGDFAGGGVQLRPYAAATVEKDFDGDERSIRFSQTASPTIVNRFHVEDGSKRPYGRLSGGASAAILTNVSLDVAASATFGKRQGEETSASVGVKVGF